LALPKMAFLDLVLAAQLSIVAHLPDLYIVSNSS
jgi:hypothetical protein